MRQSELAKLYPTHVVARWIGNSVEVGEKHYLMVTGDHFARATQKTTQTPPATPGHDATTRQPFDAKTPDCRGLASGGDS
jgi:hypothetical protein